MKATKTVKLAKVVYVAPIPDSRCKCGIATCPFKNQDIPAHIKIEWRDEQDRRRSIILNLRAAYPGEKISKKDESDGPHAGELMAIGCAPGPRTALRRLTSSLPLLRGPAEREALRGTG